MSTGADDPIGVEVTVAVGMGVDVAVGVTVALGDGVQVQMQSENAIDGIRNNNKSRCFIAKVTTTRNK